MAYVETYQDVVRPAECDHLGHMNVGRYFEIMGDGVFGLQTRLGLTPEDVRTGRRLSFVGVHVDAEWHGEVMPGEIVSVRSAVLELGTKSLRMHHRISVWGERLVFEARPKVALMDLEARRAVVIPDEVRAAAKEYMAD